MVALSKKARRNDGLNEKIDDKDSDSSVVANKKSDGVVSSSSRSVCVCVCVLLVRLWKMILI